MSLKIRPLEKKDRKDQFDCGILELNHYLQHIARQHIDKDIARTFVLIEENDPVTIIGFYTLALTGIDPNVLPPKMAKKFPRNQYIPIVKLARLGVSVDKQRYGCGNLLVINAIKRVLKTYADLGIHALFVDPKSADIIPFYEKFGFNVLSDGITMFLPLKHLIKRFF